MRLHYILAILTILSAAFAANIALQSPPVIIWPFVVAVAIVAVVLLVLWMFSPGCPHITDVMRDNKHYIVMECAPLMIFGKSLIRMSVRDSQGKISTCFAYRYADRAIIGSAPLPFVGETIFLGRKVADEADDSQAFVLRTEDDIGGLLQTGSRVPLAIY